ncbi:glycosyltransferase [Catenuloplanes japonicus]|uniref:glycosyltransferase n=1 Tax=Catenuloplanes japonicus TaxID=33876 RepID=UPI000527D7F2|nr:glycosyltransferase [Catenuloplanes japonicus]
MRVLFSCTPAIGHTYPLLPLARAFAGRGDQVAFATAAGMAPVLDGEGFTLLPAGPMPDVLFAEAEARTGQDAGADPTPASVSAFFGEVRLDTTADESLAAAREWAPDLIVNELFDLPGALTAAVLGVPLATVTTGPGAPAEFFQAIAANVAPYFTAHGLPAPATLPAGRWVLDVCPDALGPLGVPDGVTRLTLRPEAHRAPGAGTAPALAPPTPGRPRVLVTFGSFSGDREVVRTLLDALEEEIDADFVATSMPGAEEDPRFLPFQSFAGLLDGVTAVVTHGGAGTVLGALSLGLPLVVVPQGADQFVQAAAVAAAGCGVATAPGLPDPAQLRDAVRTVLTDPAIAEAAARVRKQIEAMSSPDEVAASLAATL